MRKDNYLYFIAADGSPCDNGARILQQRKELPKFANLQKGEVKVTRKKNNSQFALVIRGNTPESTQDVLEGIRTTLKIFKAIIIKETIKSVSMSVMELIENVSWSEIIKCLSQIMVKVPVKIIVCHGQVKYVAEKDRMRIIQEQHDTAVGGHKGVTKTYKRLK